MEVYIRIGEFDIALEYAQKGYEITGDKRLKEKIEMIEGGNIVTSNGWVMRKEYYRDGSFICYQINTYGSQGLKNVVFYGPDDSILSEGEQQYDENGNQIKWNSYTVKQE